MWLYSLPLLCGPTRATVVSGAPGASYSAQELLACGWVQSAFEWKKALQNLTQHYIPLKDEGKRYGLWLTFFLCSKAWRKRMCIRSLSLTDDRNQTQTGHHAKWEVDSLFWSGMCTPTTSDATNVVNRQEVSFLLQQEARRKSIQGW